jgi:signal transduction histidine kinase
VRVRSTVAATALLAVLVVAGAFLGLAVVRLALYGGDAETGELQARLVRLAVTGPALTRGDVDGGLAAVVGADADRGSHVQVVRADGQVVVASVALRGRAPLSALRPGEAQVARETVDLPGLSGSAPWVVTVLGADVDGQRFWVVVAQSTQDAQRVLHVAAALLAVGTPVLLGAIAVATWTFVGRSLRPVEAIRSTVQGITAGGLDGRVPVPAGDDEVSRLAVTMNSMLARLEASQRSQRRFVADASHELRSPVATLRAAAHVWRGQVDPEFAELVASESGRLEALVGDLLLLARADEGRLVGAGAVEVDLDEVVEAEAVRVRAVSGGSPGVRVTTVPARVRGDAGALTRAVRNLVDNAVRHAGGVVELAVAVEDGDTAGGPAGGTAVVTVADDGPGIPAGDRERVLERFVRLDESRQRGAGGTGLGLAIVAEVAAAHGGSVEVGERPGGGASLRLRLPLDGSGSGAQPPSAASR